MLIRDFLNLLLDDTLEEARLRRRGRDAVQTFLGAEQAVWDCRHVMSGNQMTADLKSLLSEARSASAAAAGRPDEAFWFAREMYVEWIANVVSVVLLMSHAEAIIPPSREAALEAARLIELYRN
jgi:hypothetical protein